MAVSDPDDAPVLACAVATKADVFVTGDKALLDLGEIEDMPILSPRQLWQRLSGFGR
jgi:predicted nucleic acid-binding protein